ncbi:metallophosphoesterase family protein [Fusibacter tunisiensis]|jgi:putative phosphoesterase|uniref:Phosphoesterase n=1 Tax=Fusibacter tunisiensis TaxID=1008308 RepID=A0ABS2MSD9_9FIRM|nr:YfcE family phosphodiesterase [Fusibacter tunisiensis]MBM7562320.1 putative phosphoesterase [Fusibacter tunisiensis]
MRIVVISDTHGKSERLMAYLEHYKDTIDEIWHLGDYHRDTEDFPDVPLFSVRGNGDLGVRLTDALILERCGHRVLLTHGHLYGVKNTLTRLYYKALEAEVDIVCFGHTHKPIHLESSGIHLFNPGSPTHPFPHTHASIGIIEFSDNEMVLKHVYL